MSTGMGKLFVLIVACILNNMSMAQTPTMQERLYYMCKVWGFVKYYHSEVSVCSTNWDSVLLDVLPDVRSASNTTEFNNALIYMLDAAGPMTVTGTALPDTLPAELKRNRDWGWISSTALRADVQIKLNEIKDNFVPHPICWVKRNDYTTSNPSWLLFPKDSLSFNTSMTYPSQDERLLLLFKYWNILKHFNPYNYVLDVPWDTTLMRYTVPIADVNNSQDFFLTLLKISKALDDAHVHGYTISYSWQKPMGYATPKVLLKYTNGEYVVMRSLETGIVKGDVIVSIDGHPVTYWEDSLRQYYSAGNESVFKRTMCENLLHRKASFTPETIVVRDATGALVSHTVNTGSPSPTNPFWGDPFFPVDSLKSTSWTTINCDIGYVNMGELLISEVSSMYASLRGKEAIIFDLRNYPNGTARNIIELMYPDRWYFAKDMGPEPTYPGTFNWYYDYGGFPGNPDAYTGKVILLIDEGTQSQGEYSSMMLERLPGAIKVGSQTAGADGNISYWYTCTDILVGFTNLGIFYPNEDSTQRIGIMPDSVIYPTIAGIRLERDELLEKALKIAGCELFATANEKYEAQIALFPNPTSETVSLRATNAPPGLVGIKVSNVSGEVFLQNELNIAAGSLSTTLDVHHLVPGMYFVHVIYGDGQTVAVKFVKNER
jgi:hypothetical protein